MLEDIIKEVSQAANDLGLAPCHVHFEMGPVDLLYEFGAYGLPGRFSHWSHGKAYHKMKTEYNYGLSHIYELVFNADPALAFIIETATPLEQKLIVAHVLAHADFFQNNIYFKHTDKSMIEQAAIHARRIKEYEFQYGTTAIEDFLDSVLSIKMYVANNYAFQRKSLPGKLPENKVHSLNEPNIGPLTRENWSALFPTATKEPAATASRLPPEPTEDILGFIMNHSPSLGLWQKDIIGMVRAEMMYFWPQIQTKIANEGWAAYWHTEIMRKLELSPAEQLEFAKINGKLLQRLTMSINPYLLGAALFRKLAAERSKEDLFLTREVCNDAYLIRNFLDEAIIKDLNLYTVVKEETAAEERYVVGETSLEKVRATLLAMITNGGYPVIVVEDGNYLDQGGLYLKHIYDGRPLDEKYAEETLKHVRKLWGKDVWLETEREGTKILMKCTANGFSRQTMSGRPQ